MHQQTPLIVDTDVGGDPDDTIALSIAARKLPQLALVTTVDEVRAGVRARFARQLLDLLGAKQVEVVSGARAQGNSFCCIDALLPAEVPELSTDVVSAVRAVAASTAGPIRWLGIGPMSNLASVLEQAPELSPRLRVTQMAGALNYRDPDRAEHNVRLDVAATARVFRAIRAGTLAVAWVLADVTFTPRTQLSAQSAVFQALREGEPWAQLIARHMARWFVEAYPATMQHDSLALSAALELPFVDFESATIELGEDGRMKASEQGVQVRVSTRARYEDFMLWLEAALGVARS
jgi:inosine-uridine nucleoside N-ribohydrolase